MFLIMALILTIGCVATSIYALKALPMFLKKIVVHNPAFAFAFNFGISLLITMLIGSGMTSGLANLTASIIFSIYCTFWYRKQVYTDA